MNVKFMSNKISLQNKKFEDFVEGIVNPKGLQKEAAVKTAEKECDEAPSSGQPEAEAKLVNDPKKKSDDKKSKSTKETKVAEVEVEVVEEVKQAKADVFVKIAKLTSKNREELRKYWRTLYPEAYVEAMLAEK